MQIVAGPNGDLVGVFDHAWLLGHQIAVGGDERRKPELRWRASAAAWLARPDPAGTPACGTGPAGRRRFGRHRRLRRRDCLAATWGDGSGGPSTSTETTAGLASALDQVSEGCRRCRGGGGDRARVDERRARRRGRNGRRRRSRWRRWALAAPEEQFFLGHILLNKGRGKRARRRRAGRLRLEGHPRPRNPTESRGASGRRGHGERWAMSRAAGSGPSAHSPWVLGRLGRARRRRPCGGRSPGCRRGSRRLRVELAEGYAGGWFSVIAAPRAADAQQHPAAVLLPTRCARPVAVFGHAGDQFSEGAVILDEQPRSSGRRWSGPRRSLDGCGWRARPDAAAN